MARLKASTTAATAAHMEVEPMEEGLASDFHLELLIYVICFGEPSTVGTLSGQWYVEDLIGFLFGKQAMGFRAVVVARLAARPWGSCWGAPLENVAAWRF
jgi:hypothetical protein